MNKNKKNYAHKMSKKTSKQTEKIWIYQTTAKIYLKEIKAVNTKIPNETKINW